MVLGANVVNHNFHALGAMDVNLAATLQFFGQHFLQIIGQKVYAHDDTFRI